MGHSYGVICKKCHLKSTVDEGGGFTFHMLRCDKCGKAHSVPFQDLGEIHLRYIKGLPGPYSVATSDTDAHIQMNYPGEPLSQEEYHAAVEKSQKPCECGGSLKFDAPARCEHCGSTDIEPDQDGVMIMYD